MKWRKHLITTGISLIISLGIQLIPTVAFSQSAGRPNPPFNPNQWDWYDCPVQQPGQQPAENDILGLPLAMKLKFPLDLIYPINPRDLDIDSRCLRTSLWGVERDMCAPMQIAQIAKNVFLLKVTLQSLLSL